MATRNAVSNMERMHYGTAFRSLLLSVLCTTIVMAALDAADKIVDSSAAMKHECTTHGANSCIVLRSELQMYRTPDLKLQRLKREL